MKIRSYCKLCLLTFILWGCDGYLEVKPDKSLLIPSELEDFRILLDNDFQKLDQHVALGFIGADNYYIQEDAWTSLNTEKERSAYLWQETIFSGSKVSDWNRPYEQVFIANVVLDGLREIEVTNENREEWQAIKGTALFIRSHAFYSLLQLFAPAYNPSTAAELAGIPLPLTVDVNAKLPRETLEDSYNEVMTSLKEAVTLLPASTKYKTRPGRDAAWALLARVALTMQDYEQAEEYAGESLAIQSELLDYSTLDPGAGNPFERFHTEVLFHGILISYSIMRRAFVVPELYGTYAEGDLRKTLYFTEEEEGVAFTGSYTGQSSRLFGGLAIDEVYLIRAECRARLGDVSGALEDLNTLLETRWEPGMFEPFTATDKEMALKVILEERRKELLFRGLRWTDLKRLNQDPRFARTLERTLKGKTYTLPPNDPRYVYPIPDQEVDINSIEDNIR